MDFPGSFTPEEYAVYMESLRMQNPELYSQSPQYHSHAGISLGNLIIVF